MKRIIQKSLGLMALITLAGTAHAVPVTVTYTADNVVNFAVVCATPTGPGPCQGGGPTLALGDEYNDWTSADTASIDLAPGQYWFTFVVENVGGVSNGNPGAFLAEIGGAVWGNTLTSSAWQVDVDRPTQFPSNATWESATEYGANGTAIWGNVLGGPIAGISTDAQWIWDFTNVEGAERITVRGLVNVPEPGTLALLGLGLMGMGMSRRKAKA